MKSLVHLEQIERHIYLIRGQKVMVDADRASLYEIETRILIQAVKRNAERFPEDFMLQLTREELTLLRSQSVISNKGRGGRRYQPYAFTEQGVAMLSSVLRSQRAIAINILIMRAFVKLRELLSTHKELARKIEELETRVGTHDQHILNIFEQIHELMTPLFPPAEPKRRIGYQPDFKSRCPLTRTQTKNPLQ
ncbi:MAG: ORF6N domain-containing protein [Elusimicrobia bacterium]|nr:ORF6N domain-containing protein [Elusimicrobiota bacterium]